MVATKNRARSNFVDGLIDYLQEIDYRLAVTDQEKEEIFRFRYDNYLKQGVAIDNASKSLSDDYDKMDNCWIFGIHYRDKLVASVRIHAVSKEQPICPSFDVFPDHVEPMIQKGYRMVDPSKFASDQSAMNNFPVLPFLTFRLACMASDYFEADYCLVSASNEHAKFYEKIIGMTRICEPRPYPLLRVPICLMRISVSECWDDLVDRFPVIRSTYTERRMLFERPTIQRPTHEQPTQISSQTSNSKLN